MGKTCYQKNITMLFKSINFTATDLPLLLLLTEVVWHILTFIFYILKLR